jgi:hypothetical protein
MRQVRVTHPLVDLHSLRPATQAGFHRREVTPSRPGPTYRLGVPPNAWFNALPGTSGYFSDPDGHLWKVACCD